MTRRSACHVDRGYRAVLPGVVQTVVRVMANSSAMLRGFLGPDGALAAGTLGAPPRDRARERSPPR
jgi:xanthine dehydrogenase molybdopterin-binding subunit B